MARLQLLHEATLAGRSIGQLVGLPNQALRDLIATDGQYRQADQVAASPTPVGDRAEPERILRSCLDAVMALDPERLTLELRRATVHLPLELLTDEVLAPLLAEIGERWMHGRLGPAQEHAASAVVQRLLGGIVRRCAPLPDALAIVVATPTGQRHELGALLVAACAAAAGWRVTYLGPDLPAGEIALAAERVGANVVALSIVHPASDAHLRDDLDTLVHRLSPGRQLVIGGTSAKGYARRLRAHGVVELENLGALREFLSRRAARSS